jgi:phage terminase small subunit
MALTPKQEKFCLVYIETGNASEAYRQAYSAGKMSAASINRTAKELMDNPKIASRVKELQAPAAEKAQVTLEQHLNDLKRLRDLAESDQKWQAAIAAEVNRGKASGLYTEKHEVAGAVDVNHSVSPAVAEKMHEIYEQKTSE